jgi:biotin operon repressor
MADAATSGISSRRKRPIGETRAMVLKRKRDGLSNREIALGCQISTQAVWQHIQSLRADGLLTEEDA